MIGAWLLLASAHADDRTLCFFAETDYDDVGLVRSSEDYWPTNINRKLRGLKVMYRGTVGGWTTVYTEVDGANEGCVTVDLVPHDIYDLQVQTIAVVDGHDILVRRSDTGNVWQVTLPSRSYQLATPVDHVVNPGVPRRFWNVLAATSWALHRRDAGLDSTFDLDVYLTDTTGQLHSPCAGSCISGTSLYLDDDLAASKFSIAYAIGRAMLNFRGLTSTDIDRTFDDTYCGDSQHDLPLNTAEYTSAASVAGFAWFYAATVFNVSTESDCGLAVPYVADWDLRGGTCFDGSESPAPHALSCAQGHHLTPPRDQFDYCDRAYLGNQLPLSVISVSLPIDWLRFWWERQVAGDYHVGSALDVYAAALADPDWHTTDLSIWNAFRSAGLSTYDAEGEAHGLHYAP
jgi:hypothetical protein